MIFLRSLAFTVIFLVWSGILSVLALPLLTSRTLTAHGITFYQRSVTFLARALIGLDYRIVGQENLPTEPAIYAVAHQSTFEALAMHLVLHQPAVVLKQELARLPFWGWYTRRGGLIPVDRGAGSSALKGLVVHARQALDRGHSVVIFPQGTRTPPGVRRPYHAGVAALYSQLKRPIVPIAVNSGVFWGRHSLIKRPGTITLEILPPIPAGRPRKEMMQRLYDDLESATDRLVREAGGHLAEADAVTASGDTARPA